MALRPPEGQRDGLFHWVQHITAPNAQPAWYLEQTDCWIWLVGGKEVRADDRHLDYFRYIGKAICPHPIAEPDEALFRRLQQRDWEHENRS